MLGARKTVKHDSSFVVYSTRCARCRARARVAATGHSVVSVCSFERECNHTSVVASAMVMTAEEVSVAEDQPASAFGWSVDGRCGDRMAILNYGLGCFAQDDKVPPHTMPAAPAHAAARRHAAAARPPTNEQQQ